MATLSTDQYVVELILDDSQLQSSLQGLVKSGAIDQKIADAFKNTTAEIKKTSDAVNPLKKSLEDVATGVKTVGASFSQGFGKNAVAQMAAVGTATKKLSTDLANSNVAVRQKIDLSGKLVLSQSKEQAAYNKVVASLKTLTGEGLKSAKALLSFSPKQVAAGFEELGVSVDQYIDSLAGAVPAQASLRQELKLLTAAIAQLKLSGEDQGEVYDELVKKAGQVKDAISDANAEIANSGSDTRGLDNLLGTAQAVTAGFAVAQGAAGLFGDESEELQKTLLKVNSAMALLQGLQQIQNALQKEGAITLLVANTQRKIQNAQLVISTALESKSVVVRGLATAAQWALNAAMAANPIGLLVTAVAGLVTALYFYNKAAGESERITGELNAALSNTGENFDESAANIRKLGEIRNAELLKAGAKQSDILRANARDEDQIAQDRIDARVALAAKIREAETSSDSDVRKRATELQADLRKLDEQEFNDRLDRLSRETEIRKVAREEDLKNALQISERRALLASEGTPAQLAAQKDAINKRLALELNAEGLLAGEIARLEAQAQKDRQQLDSDYRRRKLDAQIKDIETQLINVEEGTVEEFNLRNNLLAKQRDAELENLKLSEKEKQGIIAKSQAEQAKLRSDYDKAVIQEAIAAQVRINNTTLAQIKTNDEDRLALSISNIELQAGAEVEAANGNASKIKEINAKRDADILAVRKQFLEEAAAYEAELSAAENGANRRALEKRAAGEVAASLNQRISAIEQIREIEVAAVDASLDLVEEEYQQRLISDKEYELRRAKLLDERVKANESAEERITQTTKQANRERVDLILATSQAGIAILANIAALSASNADAEIERRKEQLEELRTAGAITEKDAAIRQKRIEADERSAKRRQAVREKALALFDAILNTAQGVTNAITTGDPYTAALRAAIAGAIGAAQIAIIAARPIPQFAVGKTSLYEGPAKVGETGAAEIIERKGRMYVVDKPTTTWIEKHDKVYTPHQTKKILAKAQPGKIVNHTTNESKRVFSQTTHRTTNQITNYRDAPQRKGLEIDYDKLTASMAKQLKDLKTTNVNIDADGFSIKVKQGMDMRKYIDNRYNSNGK